MMLLITLLTVLMFAWSVGIVFNQLSRRESTSWTTAVLLSLL